MYIDGTCHLCDVSKPLAESHLFPAAAYRRYPSDTTDGGRFYDFAEDRFHNKQLKRNWFCDDCEKRLKLLEDSGVSVMDKIEAEPLATHPYDSNFCGFLTSISWRLLKLEMEDIDELPAIEGFVLNFWKRFIKGEIPDVGPYTQHVFQMYDTSETKHHMRLDAKYLPDLGLMFSVVGPFTIQGVTNPHKSDDELQILEQTRIAPSAGQLANIDKLRVFGNITLAFARFLDDRQAACTKQLRESLAVARDIERKKKTNR